MTLRVLGGVAVAVDGHPVDLGGPRQRAVLARIVLGGDAPVTAEQIVDDLWAERAQASTPTSVHAYVSRLRRILGENAVPRRPGGYVVDRAFVTVDAEVFTRDVDAGRHALARGADSVAAARLQVALARWGGPLAYAGLGDPAFLAPEIARLNELRYGAAENLADAHARLGRSAEIIQLLEELAGRDPLRETLAVRLVTALAVLGRQSDALAAYERCRVALAGELGVDPAPELRRVHEAVLAQVPLVADDGPARRTALPPRSRAFLGRERLIATVEALLDGSGPDGGGRPVALCGLAGAGKTELAREIAHRRHREGRVAWWIAAEDPAAIAAGLADLAGALGIAPHRREEDARAALWAELDRSPGWVLVFDNVEEPSRLEPFLPAAGHGDILVTSRNPAWRRLAHTVAVLPLARAESLLFVADRTGEADAVAATALAELVGDLPIALAQACAYVEQTGMPVHDYVRLFRRRPVDLTAGGIGTTWGLAADRLRRRSALGTTVLETMAFLAADAVPVDMLAPLAEEEWDLQDAIGELLRLALVDRVGPSLRVHRLVQDVVRSRLSGADARERLMEAAGLAVAHDLLDGGATAHLVALTAHATALGIVPDGLLDTVAAAAGRLAARALYPAAEQLLRAALQLAGIAGDPFATGSLLCRLGEVLDAAGRLTEALDLHTEAVTLLAGAPDRIAAARAHNRLGHVLNCADRATEAIEAHERALTALADADRADLTGPVLVDLGYTLWAVGELDRATEAFSTGRAHLDVIPRGRDWAHATAGLGMVAQDRGDLDAAVALQRMAIEVFTEVCGADHPDTAQAFDKLGYVLRRQGNAQEAIDAHGRAARLLARVLGDDDPRVAMTLTNLGLAHAAAGDRDAAVDAQTRAQMLFRDAYGPVHAHTLLAARRRALALAAAGSTAMARVLIEEVLASVSTRPDAAEIAQDAAAVYTAIGDHAAARRWSERARV